MDRETKPGFRTCGGARRSLIPALTGSRRWFVGWLCLSGAAATLLFSVDFLPFYDYYEWLFQGHLVAGLLFGVAGGDNALGSLYGLSPVPVPNLAAPLLIGLLNVALPIEMAGRVFLAVTVLAFANSFAYMVRSFQRQPTVVEFTGFLWAFGFFLYRGYLSYLFALSLSFLLIGKLHTSVAISSRTPTRLALWYLSGLGVILYLSHLLAWAVGFLATLVHVVVLTRRGGRRSAAALALTLLPALVLLAWYTVAEHGGSHISFYETWQGKAQALMEPVQLFLRLDPFPPTFPIFVANLCLGLALVVLLVPRLNRPALRDALVERPTLSVAGLLAGIALLLPVETLNGNNNPDGRFVLPALLILVAALPYRAFSARRQALTIGLVVLVLGLHVAEYSAVEPRIRGVDALTGASVPARSPILHVAIPSNHGCTQSFGPSIGSNTLRWITGHHALETGQRRVNFSETSFVYSRYDYADPPGVTVLTPTPKNIGPTVLPLTAMYRYPYVQAIGCPDDLATIERLLASAYEPIRRTEGLDIFRRRG